MVTQMERSPLPSALRAPIANSVALLLESRIPARLAWVGGDGEPRIAPIWFSWTGEDIVMSTFAGSRKTADLVDGTIVSVSIDTEAFPYRNLSMRGPIVVSPSDGLTQHYRDAATRYLGAETGERWLDFLGSPDQVLMTMRPEMAVTSDMATESPFFTS